MRRRSWPGYRRRRWGGAVAVGLGARSSRIWARAGRRWVLWARTMEVGLAGVGEARGNMERPREAARVAAIGVATALANQGVPSGGGGLASA